MVPSCLMHRTEADTPQPCCLPSPTKGWTKLVPATQLPSPHTVLGGRGQEIWDKARCSQKTIMGWYLPPCSIAHLDAGPAA